MRALPSLIAMRAFEAAARLGSFTLAARELGITQASMSYQIKRLETQLATTLFIRRNRSVVLTADGERIARPLTRAFDLLEEAVTGRAGGATLSIRTTVSFAHMWLIPRLADFQERHPTIELKIVGVIDLRAMEGGDYDVGLWLGRGDWAPLTAEKLFDVELTPMCSPAYLAALGDAPSVADLAALPLIAPDDRRWDVWFADAGHAYVPRARGLRIANQNDVLAAACAGQGFCLGIPFFAAPYLADGSLVRPFRQVSKDGTGYWFVHEPDRRRDRRIMTFRRWLIDALAAYVVP